MAKLGDVVLQEEPKVKISELPRGVIDPKSNVSMRDILEEIKLQVKEVLEEGGKESTQETLQEALAIMYQISLVGSLPDNLQQELESFLWRNYDRE
jgi:hypothetical protein